MDDVRFVIQGGLSGIWLLRERVTLDPWHNSVVFDDDTMNIYDEIVYDGWREQGGDDDCVTSQG